VPHVPISHSLSRGRNLHCRMCCRRCLCRPTHRLRKALNPSSSPPPRVSRAHRNQSNSSKEVLVLEQAVGMRMVISEGAVEAGAASLFETNNQGMHF
jgi:hypothetical protein